MKIGQMKDYTFLPIQFKRREKHMDKNKVMFGLRNVHVAFKTEEDTYEVPKPMPGAVNLSLSSEGDTETFYADDVPYFTFSSNNGYTGDLEMAIIPDWFSMEALGWMKDDSGMVLEVSDGVQKDFALLFEVQGDKAKKRYVYYNCNSAKPTEEHGTIEEGRTPQTQTSTITIIPQDFDGKSIVKGSLEMSLETATAFNTFYTAVLEPTFTPGP